MEDLQGAWNGVQLLNNQDASGFKILGIKVNGSIFKSEIRCFCAYFLQFQLEIGRYLSGVNPNFFLPHIIDRAFLSQDFVVIAFKNFDIAALDLVLTADVFKFTFLGDYR